MRFKEYRDRELAWVTYIAPHQNPKKMKKHINHFWRIDDDDKPTGPTPEMIETMRKAKERYLKEVKEKQNGREQ